MLQGFKQFILRGNVLDLAVAVVMGVAFGAVVTALVKDLITPLIGAIGASWCGSPIHATPRRRTEPWPPSSATTTRSSA